MSVLFKSNLAFLFAKNSQHCPAVILRLAAVANPRERVFLLNQTFFFQFSKT